MNKIILPWFEAKPIINEGDVLLFRGQGWMSKVIGSQTQTPYSHVAVASWVNGDSNTLDGQLECVEFREWKGGRSINLYQAVLDNLNSIDVYRPVPYFSKLEFNPETKQTEIVRKEFNGKKVTRVMREMTGLPYGWKRIWWMTKHKMVFIRLLPKENLADDKLKDIIYPVCSTSLAYAFSRNDFDLLCNRSDESMEPGHIAYSPRINYLFTIGI